MVPLRRALRIMSSGTGCSSSTSIIISSLDIMGADFYHVLDMIHDRLKCNAVPIQLPIGSEESFKGIIDLVEMKPAQ